MDAAEELLRRLALNDERSVAMVLASGSGPGTDVALIPKVDLLVRLGALVAAGAATTSLRRTVELARAAGASDAEIVRRGPRCRGPNRRAGADSCDGSQALWLCAVGILTLVLRNRSLRERGGDIPVRFRATPGKRWRRGHALWVHDVLAFRASPAGWSESLLWTTAVVAADATEEERSKLHRLGDHPVIARITVDAGDTVEIASAATERERVLDPYAGLPEPGVRRTEFDPSPDTSMSLSRSARR